MKSIKVEQALKKFGAGLQTARKRRRIKQALMAERIGVSVSTLMKMEQGDGSVKIESYAMALMVFNQLEALADIFEKDTLGIDLMDEQLPERIRSPKWR